MVWKFSKASVKLLPSFCLVFVYRIRFVPRIRLFCTDIRKTMDSQYSGSLVGDDYSENSMETHAEGDSSITTEERDENSSEEEQSSITTENSSEEEIDLWSTLISDAASKVQDQYDDILQELLMEGQSERASLCANSNCFSKGTGRCLNG